MPKDDSTKPKIALGHRHMYHVFQAGRLVFHMAQIGGLCPGQHFYFNFGVAKSLKEPGLVMI
jgi:hypothetical protein